MGLQLQLPFLNRLRKDPEHTRLPDYPTPDTSTGGLSPPSPGSRAYLERTLQAHIAEPIEVTITNNRKTMISMRRRSGLLQLRMHHMFLTADDTVIRAIGKFLTGHNKKANRIVDDFIEKNGDVVRARSRRTVLRTEGRYHDLQSIFDRLNQTWFDGEVDASITWGRYGTPPKVRGRRRSIRLGTYADDEKLIRIHPALDQDWVPGYALEAVVYHEMLHAVVPAEMQGNKKVFHTAEFRRRERAFPDYERATEWERQNLNRILSS